MNTENRRRVLVTGTGGRSFGAGVLHSLLRSSPEVRARWQVVAADADPFSWGMYKADERILLPVASDARYIEFVNRAIRSLKLDAIVPGTEIETERLLNSKHELEPVHLITNRRELIPLMMDKFQLQQKLIELGLPLIKTRPLTEWKEALAEHGFPLLIKPTVGTGGSKGVQLVCSEEEIRKLIEFVDPKTRPCVQPYIGESGEEYTVGVLSDKRGNLIDSFVLKRKLIGLSLGQSRSFNGNTHQISTGYSQGFIVKDREIQEFCEKIAFDLKSTGPLNVQLRKVDGKIYVFELHPRFSGTTPIRADAGFNEVDLLLRNAVFDETFSRIEYRYNLAAIRAFEHVLVPIDTLGGVSLP